MAKNSRTIKQQRREDVTSIRQPRPAPRRTGTRQAQVAAAVREQVTR